MYLRKRMRVVAIIIIMLLSVVLVVSLTCLTSTIRQTSSEKALNASDQQNTAANDESSMSNNAKDGSSVPKEPSGYGSQGNPGITNEPVPNKSATETPKDQNTTNSSTSTTPPDGRIYYGGEEPYAYIPTYSPKQNRLPIVPLPGE
jgi:type II secretory pathway pseudopilin PulG